MVNKLIFQIVWLLHLISFILNLHTNLLISKREMQKKRNQFFRADQLRSIVDKFSSQAFFKKSKFSTRRR